MLPSCDSRLMSATDADYISSDWFRVEDLRLKTLALTEQQPHIDRNAEIGKPTLAASMGMLMCQA